MDRVDTANGVIVTAEGLLTYLPGADALCLIAACAARFPSGRMVFDPIPHWVSQRSLKGMRRSDRYTVPPMPFSLSADEARALLDTIPGVNRAGEILLTVGRGVCGG